jgi:hypothetical protein
VSRFFVIVVALCWSASGCSSPSSHPEDARVHDAEPRDGDGARDSEPAAVDAAPGVRDADVDAAAPPPWRSALYPDDWTPGFVDDEGRGVHDFSYAGYHLGEAELGAHGPTEVVNVVDDFGADPMALTDATAAIQGAIDEASSREDGAVVVFPEGLYRVDGVLSVTSSRVVLRGEGATRSRLYFTKVSDMDGRGHLQFGGAPVEGDEVPLAADGISGDSVVLVEDAGDLRAGDDVAVGWVITDDFVADHGMTGTWVAFNGTWQTFFRRTVAAVDRSSSPARVILDVPLRYRARLRDGASIRRESGYLSEVGVESLGLANAGSIADAWSMNGVGVLRFDFVKDAWVSGVASFPSPNAPTFGPGEGAHLLSKGVTLVRSKRVTVADSSMEYAENRGSNGNGYLFEVRQSSEVLLRDLVATRGRHNFIQNWGFGTSGMVWLRVRSADSLQEVSAEFAGFGLPCHSDFHHSLAMANLIDGATFDDGFRVVNRHDYSSGAGLTGTESVLWNARGRGTIASMQYRNGYIIGSSGVNVVTSSVFPEYEATAPEDYVEGLGEGATLEPSSLYEDQLRRRMGAGH